MGVFLQHAPQWNIEMLELYTFFVFQILDGSPVWYYRILTTLCARLVLVHKECRHVNENAHRAHFAETAHPAADFFFAMNAS